MTNDDIAQKLALLPEGVAERNLQSWNKAVEDFGGPVYAFQAEYFPYVFEMHKLAITFSKSEQAKLFRAEAEFIDTLVIDRLHMSTTDGRVKIGEPYLSVSFGRGFLTALYIVKEEELKSNVLKRKEDNIHFRTGNDAITFLQPMLDLLWNETRGKKNA